MYNTLGYGFLEKVYENALMLEIDKRGIPVVQQQPIKVFYEDWEVGRYCADLIVAQKVLVEVKAVDTLHPRHEAQLVNYLKGTTIEVGIIKHHSHHKNQCSP